MDKTININLGGSLFQVDEEAFYILRDYIQAIKQGGFRSMVLLKGLPADSKIQAQCSEMRFDTHRRKRLKKIPKTKKR